MSIKLVVFDMAGTTVEDKSNVALMLQLAMAEYGYEVSIEEVNVVMGYPKPVAIRALLRKFNSEANDELVAAIYKVFATKMQSFYELDPGVREKDGVRDTFMKLKEKNIKIGIDTGFSRNIADVIFERLGWKKDAIFDVSIASDEVENGRPFPDMIYKAMDMLEITSVSEVAKVGDTVSDLQEGNAAGCKYVIGVTSGSYTAEELSKEKHTHLVSHLSEVVDIVSGNDNGHAGTRMGINN